MKNSAATLQRLRPPCALNLSGQVATLTVVHDDTKPSVLPNLRRNHWNCKKQIILEKPGKPMQNNQTHPWKAWGQPLKHAAFIVRNVFSMWSKKHKPPHGSSLYTSQCKGASRTLAPAQKGWEGAGSNAPQDKPNHKNHFSSGLRWRYFACKYPRYFQWGLWLRHAPQTLFAIFWCSTYQCKWLQNARVVVPLLGWGKLRIGARKGGYITCHLEEQLWIPDHLITKHMMLAWMSIISSCSYKVSSSCFKPCFLSRHRPFLACWHDWCQSSLQLPAMHWQSASNITRYITGLQRKREFPWTHRLHLLHLLHLPWCLVPFQNRAGKESPRQKNLLQPHWIANHFHVHILFKSHISQAKTTLYFLRRIFVEIFVDVTQNGKCLQISD